jgi:hypothetical protein
MSADKKSKRKYTHIAFSTITCPFVGKDGEKCDAGKGGKPQTGSVPGIKRHFKRVHGEPAFAKAEKDGLFPPIRDLTKLTAEELKELAKRKNVDAAGMNKSELVAVLS